MHTMEIARTNLLIRDRTRYPFDRMTVGDSLHIDDFRQAESARVAAIQFVRRRALDWRFSLRKFPDGWRLVRVA
jgi:hypothetical protein